MTAKQKSLFIEAAQAGIACGLWHPHEWYVNYVRVLFQLLPYNEVDERATSLGESFIAFYRECMAYPDDPIGNLDEDGFAKMINQHYGVEK